MGMCSLTGLYPQHTQVYLASEEEDDEEDEEDAPRGVALDAEAVRERYRSLLSGAGAEDGPTRTKDWAKGGAEGPEAGGDQAVRDKGGGRWRMEHLVWVCGSLCCESGSVAVNSVGAQGSKHPLILHRARALLILRLVLGGRSGGPHSVQTP